MNRVTFKCDWCQKVKQVPQEYLNKKVKCKCGTVSRVKVEEPPQKQLPTIKPRKIVKQTLSEVPVMAKLSKTPRQPNAIEIATWIVVPIILTIILLTTTSITGYKYLKLRKEFKDGNIATEIAHSAFVKTNDMDNKETMEMWKGRPSMLEGYPKTVEQWRSDKLEQAKRLQK